MAKNKPSKRADFAHVVTFNVVARSVKAESKRGEKILSKASIDEIRKFVPDVNVSKNEDLVPIAFNAFVANRFNLNGDGVSGATAKAIAKHFINKPINVEHNRENIVGFITNYAFTKFGSDDELSDKDLKEMVENDDPFNVTLGGVVWRIANDGLASILEESNSPKSDVYMGVSASWELGFNESFQFRLVGSTEDYASFKDSEISSELETCEKAFASGEKIQGKKVYREILDGDSLPLGIGLTEDPAAEVRGVAVDPSLLEELEEAEAKVDNKELLNKINEVIKLLTFPYIGGDKNSNSAFENGGRIEGGRSSENYAPGLVGIEYLIPKDSIEKLKNIIESIDINKINTKKDKNISQSKKTNVSEDRQVLKQVMKVENYKDITTEWLKSEESNASSVNKLIVEEIRKVSEKYETDLKAEQEAKAQAIQKQKEITEANEKLQDNFKSLEDKVNKLEAEKLDREKNDKFQERLATIDDKYELTDKDREIVGRQIENLTDDQFGKYQEDLQVMFKDKDKEVIAQKAALEAKANKNKGNDKPETQVSTAELLDKLFKSANKEDETIANAGNPEEDNGVLNRIGDAFSFDKLVKTHKGNR